MVTIFTRIIERHPFICLALIALLTCAPTFINGLPLISSYAHNILLHEGFSLQMQSGTLYPRWLPELYNGYGGASGFYYPPLLFWFSGFIDIFTMNMLSSEQALICVVFLALALSGFCFYFFARGYCNVRYSVALAALYMMLPYHFSNDILLRSALAEFLAYIFLPVIFSCIRKDMFQVKRYMIGYSLSYTALIFSHLPTALIASFLIGIYSIFIVWPNNKEHLHFIARFIFLSIISIGVSAIYLFPAIAMLDYMNLDSLKYFSVHNSFIDDFNGPYDDGMLLTLFSVAVAMLIIATLILIGSYSTSFRGARQFFIFLYVLNVLFFFMMTSYSSFIWDSVPLISSIQFPWRLLIFSDFFTLFLAVQYIKGEKNAEYRDQLLILMFSYCIIMYFLVHIATYNKPPEIRKSIDDNQIAQIQNKAPNPEHIPKNDFYTPPSFPSDIKIERRDIVSVVKGEGLIELKEHKPLTAVFAIENPSTPIDVEFRQFMFYNWRLMDLATDKDVTELYNLRAAAPYGQMQFSVPAGAHTLRLTLEKNIYEYVGELLSIVSLCVLLIWICIIKSRKQDSIPV